MTLLVCFSSKGREFHAVGPETANECSVNLSLVYGKCHSSVNLLNEDALDRVGT